MIRLLFVLIISLAVPHLAGAKNIPVKSIDSAVYLLHRQALFNGVILIAEKGKVVYQRAFGVADISTRQPLTMSSSFNMASVSKQFFTMMIMMLKEQNKVSYDDPVSKYLMEFPYPGITVRHLMTHTSGLPEYFELAQRYNGPLDTLTNPKLLRLISDVKPGLIFQPGARWSYCNTNYAIIASIIEVVSGMPANKMFQDRIAGPLGMKNTVLYNLTLKMTVPNRVYGFRRENGKEVMNELGRFDGVWGDGNVYASAEDLLKWDQALYGEKLVKQSTLREAFQPVKLNDGTTFPYGFGWRVEPNGVISHTGGWVGFRNIIIRDIPNKRTIIVLSNGTNDAFNVRSKLFSWINGERPTVPATQLITHVSVIDGTGLAAFNGSVRLLNDKIWEVGSLSPFESEGIVDGKGLVLSPGFIDTHSHHDWGSKEHPEILAAINQGITTIVVGQDGGGNPIDSIRSQLKKHPLSVNLATYTGHTTLRIAAMGPSGVLRNSRPEELEKMKSMLQSELTKGSLGLASGLEYERAFFSSRHEVLELAKVTASQGGRYISHIRSEDMNMDDAIEEIKDIGRQAKLPVQVSHMKIALKDRWGSAGNLLVKLEEARTEGINITADAYPYDYWMSTLRVLFPKRDYKNPASAEFAVQQLFDPDGSVLVAFAPHPEYAGKTVGEVARLNNEKPSVTLMRLVDEAEKFELNNKDKNIDVETIMGKSMSEKDVANILAWPHTNVCSDGAVYGHPRGFGTFPRVLGRYVREQRVMTLETAINKMTGLSAEHLGITGRGLIASGQAADLVLFDPATIIDQATIENPGALSTGIRMVWVNGKVVYEDGKATSTYPGVFLSRQGLAQ